MKSGHAVLHDLRVLLRVPMSEPIAAGAPAETASGVVPAAAAACAPSPG